VIVRFVDIGEIVDDHSLNFLFIATIYQYSRKSSILSFIDLLIKTAVTVPYQYRAHYSRKSSILSLIDLLIKTAVTVPYQYRAHYSRTSSILSFIDLLIKTVVTVPYQYAPTTVGNPVY
jgi:hypothetical protein